MDPRIHTLDFETTDVDAKKCRPVEVALVNSEYYFETFINPGCPIPPETSAVHHITDEDVALAPSWEEVRKELTDRLTMEPLAIVAAHNAEYERNVIGDAPFANVLWICTYKCALRIWPDAPSHKNESLRYYLKLGDFRGRNHSQSTHSALHDCRVTMLLLQELLNHATLEQLIEWTEQPAKLPRMPMGKHYGQTWDTVPGPYLQWCINQTDMREDVKYCASEELKRRKGART